MSYGRYYTDATLSDRERASFAAPDRYKVVVRDSLRPAAWVFRFEHYDYFVEQVLSRLNTRGR